MILAFFSLHGKVQEPGLVEIIPLIWTSTIYGQYPVLYHPEPLKVHYWGWLLGGQAACWSPSWDPSGLTAAVAQGLVAAASFVCLAGGIVCPQRVPQHCTHVHSFKAAAISPNLGMDWDPSLWDTDRSWHNLNDQDPLKLKLTAGTVTKAWETT